MKVNPDIVDRVKRLYNRIRVNVGERAVRIHSKDGPAYYDLGKAKADLGDHRGSVLAFDRAIDLGMDFAATFCFRGESKYALQDYDGAISDFTQSIALEPSAARALYFRSECKAKIGQYEDAILDMAESIRFQPDVWSSHANLARFRWWVGDLNGAISDYTEAIRLAPDDVYNYLQRAFVRSLAGDAAGAREDSERVLEADPANSDALVFRGNYYAGLNEDQAAIAAYEAIIHVDPNYSVAHFNLACMHARAGNLATSLGFLRQTFELEREATENAKTDPDFDSIRETPEFIALLKEFE